MGAEYRMEQLLAGLKHESQKPEYTRIRLTSAFAALRRKGYLAKQSYTCCGGCAGVELAELVKGMPQKKRKSLRGGVYYHQQDALELHRMYMGQLHIRYGQITVHEGSMGTSTYGKLPKEIGEDVVQALREQGLCVEWDGKPERTIIVTGLDQTVLDAAAAVVRLGGDYRDVLTNRASGKKRS